MAATSQMSARGASGGVHRTRTVVCSNASHTPAAPQQVPRRALLAVPALLAASWQARQALAYGQNWDGESAAIGSCALGDPGEECRIKALSKDKAIDYGAATDNRRGRGPPTAGTNPVATLSDQYRSDTVALSDKILQYASLDLYDPERPKVIKAIKADSPVWVSRYARGGSARTLSARRFYIVVDALSGHLASNGAAPFPAAKLKQLVGKVEESLALLAEGK